MMSAANKIANLDIFAGVVGRNSATFDLAVRVPIIVVIYNGANVGNLGVSAIVCQDCLITLHRAGDVCFNRFFWIISYDGGLRLQSVLVLQFEGPLGSNL